MLKLTQKWKEIGEKEFLPIKSRILRKRMKMKSKFHIGGIRAKRNYSSYKIIVFRKLVDLVSLKSILKKTSNQTKWDLSPFNHYQIKYINNFRALSTYKINSHTFQLFLSVKEEIGKRYLKYQRDPLTLIMRYVTCQSK